MQVVFSAPAASPTPSLDGTSATDLAATNPGKEGGSFASLLDSSTGQSASGGHAPTGQAGPAVPAGPTPAVVPPGEEYENEVVQWVATAFVPPAAKTALPDQPFPVAEADTPDAPVFGENCDQGEGEAVFRPLAWVQSGKPVDAPPQAQLAQRLGPTPRRPVEAESTRPVITSPENSADSEVMRQLVRPTTAEGALPPASGPRPVLAKAAPEAPSQVGTKGLAHPIPAATRAESCAALPPTPHGRPPSEAGRESSSVVPPEGNAFPPSVGIQQVGKTDTDLLRVPVQPSGGDATGPVPRLAPEGAASTQAAVSLRDLAAQAPEAARAVVVDGVDVPAAARADANRPAELPAAASPVAVARRPERGRPDFAAGALRLQGGRATEVVGPTSAAVSAPASDEAGAEASVATAPVVGQRTMSRAGWQFEAVSTEETAPPRPGQARGVGNAGVVVSQKGIEATVAKMPASAVSETLLTSHEASTPKGVLANPVLATPTLAQVLVENAPAAKPHAAKLVPEGPLPEVANPVAKTVPAPRLPEATPDGSSGDRASLQDGGGAAVRAKGGDQVSDTAREAASNDPGVRVRGAREILAAERGRGLVGVRPAPGAVSEKNFLRVDQQGVGASETRVGTGVAKEAQTMTAHAPVLPHASSALDVSEPAAVGSAGNVNHSILTKPHGEAEALRSFAAASVREAMDAAEQAQQTGRNHVELRLQTPDAERLRIHLRWHDGVVHAKFVTQSSDLQQVLSREWDLLTPRWAEKGIKFGESTFEKQDQSGQSANQNAFTHDHQRHSSREQGRAFEPGEEYGFTFPSVAAVQAGVAKSREPAAALPAAPAISPTADTRNLRAWA